LNDICVKWGIWAHGSKNIQELHSKIYHGETKSYLFQIDTEIEMNQLRYSSTFVEFVRKIVFCLENSGLTYVIVGGVVLSVWGKLKKSQDVDVILSKSNKQENILRFQNLLKTLGFGKFTTLNIDKISEMFENKDNRNATKMVSINHKDLSCDGCRFDLSLENNDLDKRALANRKRGHLLEQNAFIESPEDLIIGKIEYGATPFDLADAQSIVDRQQNDLNLDYLREIADSSGFRNTLDVLLSQVQIYWLFKETEIVYDRKQNKLVCNSCQNSNCNHHYKFNNEKFLEKIYLV